MQWNINKKANLKQRITLLTIIALALIAVTTTYAAYTVNKDLTDISGGKENININFTHSASTNPTGSAQSNTITATLGYLESQSSCECPGQGNDWTISPQDNCAIRYDCNIGTGTLSFTGTGNIILNATITTKNMNPPPAGVTVYLGSNALINVVP